MTIQNQKLYMEGVWDWAILRGCFGSTKIEPTDIDGFVERKGRFLILETKKLDTPIKNGQWWTFNALRNTGLFTIIVVWGEQNTPQEMQILYPLPYQVGQRKKAGLDELLTAVAGWFRYADREPLSSPRRG